MRYRYHNGEVVEAHRVPRTPPKRSHLSAPYVRSDGMADTMNPANGLLYDSRSAYERAVKDAGCVIIGDDKGFHERGPVQADMPPVEQDIKDAIDQLGG